MSFFQGLVSIRSHLVFLVALICSFSAVIYLEMWDPRRARDRLFGIEPTPGIELARHGPLNQTEVEWARTAWRYFENNTRDATGLVDSAKGRRVTSMWDTGSYLMSLISARRLGIVGAETFEERMRSALDSLAALPLLDAKLPNRYYDSATLAMVSADGTPTEVGEGWSSLGIARLAVPLTVLIWEFPEFTPKVRRLIERWDWSKLVQDGFLVGSYTRQAQKIVSQEGRLGFEEYASRALRPLGLDADEAGRYLDYLIFVKHDGLQIPADARPPDPLNQRRCDASEAYILDGIEHGFDENSRELAYRLLQAHEGGFYSANCNNAPDQDRVLRTSVAFGWRALFASPYTRHLVEHVSQAHHPDQGWDEGIDEMEGQPVAEFTLGTNALVLEALTYQRFGALAAPRGLLATDEPSQRMAQN